MRSWAFLLFSPLKVGLSVYGEEHLGEKHTLVKQTKRMNYNPNVAE